MANICSRPAARTHADIDANAEDVCEAQPPQRRHHHHHHVTFWSSCRRHDGGDHAPEWCSSHRTGFFMDELTAIGRPLTFRALAGWREEELLAKFSAVFVPGGHAPLVDLWNDADLGQLWRSFAKNRTLTGAICHGPVAFGSAAIGGGVWPYKDVAMTCFSTEGDQHNEKKWGGKLPSPPGYPAVFLAGLGAAMAEGPEYASHVVEDVTANLVTGQNPASAPAFGKALLARVLAQQGV